jgi:hypothetical protein
MRTLVSSLIGTFLGALLAAVLLRATVAVVRWTVEPVMAVEHWVIYVGILIGAGFGSVSGAMVGLVGVITKAGHERVQRSP